MIRGHKCDYKKQIREELLDDAVAEVIIKLVSNPKFAAMMQEKINMKVDTAAIDQEIANYEKQLRQHYSIKTKLAEEIDSLDPDDRHYVRRKADLEDRLYRMYDKIEDTESLLIAARAKKQAIEAEKLTGDNIYKVLIYFEKLYGVMNDVERRQLMEILISEIQIYPERQANGQWLKSIKFKLPIIEEDMSIGLDNKEQVETLKALLLPLGTLAPPAPNPGYKTRHFLNFTIRGVEVDVMGGMVIVKDGKDYDCSLSPSQVAEYIWINGERIPLQSLEDWRRYYLLMGREEKAAMIDC